MDISRLQDSRERNNEGGAALCAKRFVQRALLSPNPLIIDLVWNELASKRNQIIES
jgi:hypothetical protein